LEILIRYRDDRKGFNMIEISDLPSYGFPEIIKVNDRISYIPACEKPLSADIGIIRGDSKIYLYDVGSTLQALNYLYSLPDDKVIVISHFHGDHTWWLGTHRPGDSEMGAEDNVSPCYERPKYSKLYVSKQSAKYTNGGDIVTEPVVIEDGVKIEIAPIPSTHAKGSLALTVDDEIMFVGDATYSASDSDGAFYNAQLLQEEIAFLETSPAAKVFLSHERRPLKPKAVIVRQLSMILGKWDKSGPKVYL